MDIEAIDTPGQLQQLRPEWESLWHRSLTATPFQHPGWLIPWWNSFGGGELYTFAARAQGRLIGLAPMFLHSCNGRRQVKFLGNGISDYLDILCEPDGGPAVAGAMFARLAERRDSWDLCDLQDLRRQSALLELTSSLPLESATRPQYACSVIPLAKTVEEFEQSLPHGLRRNLRRYRSQLEGEGPVGFETAGPGQFEEHVDALFALHRARWNEKHSPGVLSDPGVERFHHSAVRDLWQSGLVRLHALRCGGTIVAVVYALAHRKRAYSYLGGFDPRLARFSPGALIMKYTIDRAIGEGVQEFDFLRGSEPYKSEWGARPQATSRLLLWHQHRPDDLLENAAPEAE
ncbi:MAG: GNAT family N-acetyltransferase [Acidobacteriota bacterium]|nr:GNAT family N-acetyltransferase [Acidobacteriota bacterium]